MIITNLTYTLYYISYFFTVSNFDFDDVNIEKSFYLPAKAYGRSKAANILFSRALHLKLRVSSLIADK